MKIALTKPLKLRDRLGVIVDGSKGDVVDVADSLGLQMIQKGLACRPEDKAEKKPKKVVSNKSKAVDEDKGE